AQQAAVGGGPARDAGGARVRRGRTKALASGQVATQFVGRVGRGRGLEHLAEAVEVGDGGHPGEEGGGLGGGAGPCDHPPRRPAGPPSPGLRGALPSGLRVRGRRRTAWPSPGRAGGVYPPTRVRVRRTEGGASRGGDTTAPHPPRPVSAQPTSESSPAWRQT